MLFEAVATRRKSRAAQGKAAGPNHAHEQRHAAANRHQLSQNETQCTLEEEGAGCCTAEGGAADVRAPAFWSSGFMAGNSNTCTPSMHQVSHVLTSVSSNLVLVLDKNSCSCSYSSVVSE